MLAYLAALAAGVLAGAWAASAGASALVTAAVADVAATVAIFAASLIFRNASFYDAYWSVVPPVLFAFWVWAGSGWDLRTALAMLVVLAWAVRLTANWARGWEGLDHEDWRYLDLREKSGAAYPLVNFLGIHFFPTVMVFLGCLPLWALTRSYEPANWLDGLAFIVGLGSVYLSWVADEALRRFRAQRADASKLLADGIWARCRHPNYLGEIGFWFALAGFGLAAGAGIWVTVGAFAMLGMFVFITIPMIDNRMLARKPAYADYHARTPMLIPKVAT